MSKVLVFDSGVGGLSIVRSLQSQLPDLVIDYAADAGFFPYGLKSDAQLQARLPTLCEALVRESKPDVLVIACNTASTLALETVRAKVGIPVVGTVPAIKPAAEQTKTGVIGVLATPGTTRRKYLDDLELKFASKIKVLRHGSAGLVELAERYIRGEDLDQALFDKAVHPLFEQRHGDQIDIVVLACTHFPLIKKRIELACPKHVSTLIDTSDAIARQVKNLLNVENEEKNSPIGRVLLTGGRANKDAYFPALEKFGYYKVDVIDL